MHKLLKGSFIILIGTIFFRVGGYIFMVLMLSLLDINAYGMLNTAMSFQWILILIAVAGLPPAIAKYVSEYLAKDNKYMVKKVIFSSLKIMILMSVVFVTVFYFSAGYISDYMKGGPELTALLQAVSFIAPFSVILGLFRGVFQGYQEMTDIMITRAVEQIFMISLAVVFILAGFYVLGAVVGSIIGFAIAAASAVIIFRKKFWDGLKNVKKPEKTMGELKLVKMLLLFSTPVIITGLAELTLFQTVNFIVPPILGFSLLGYYNVASPIARLPLVISSSVAVVLLPAASEAFALNGSSLVKKYVSLAYRYLLMVLLPLCAIVIIFGEPIMQLLFPSKPMAYSFSGTSLMILVVGMAFFSVYGISASVLQGAGKPYPAMVYLVIGTVSNLLLTVFLVPILGLIGAAIATTIASFIIMVLTTKKTLQVTGTELDYSNLTKIGLAATIAGALLIFLPKTILTLFVAVIILPLIYIMILAFTNTLVARDISMIQKVSYRSGPFKKPLLMFTEFLNKFVKESV
jgi:stage V sporulation protein B